MAVTKGDAAESPLPPTWSPGSLNRGVTMWESGNSVLTTQLSKLSFETVSSKGCQRTLEKNVSPAREEPLIVFCPCLMASLPLWDEID